MSETETEVKDEALFKYYELMMKFITPMLGTNSEFSIMLIHSINKAIKQAKAANALTDRITKALDKYRGTEITEERKNEELQTLLRTFGAIVGETLKDIPDDLEEMEKINERISEKYHELLKMGEEQPATVFLKKPHPETGEMWPVIKTHMILGNVKAILKVIINNGDKSILKSKVSVGEVCSTDLKFEEQYLFASEDIMKDEDGKRILCERPVTFSDNFGNQETAILASEQLPEGTELRTILRVRNLSPLDEKALNKIFGLGKNQGLGAWRGSGGMGAYKYKLKYLPDYQPEPDPDGWK